MTSDIPRLFARLETKYKKKLMFIAKSEGRSLNMQVRQILIQYIRNFEKKFGKIDVNKTEKD